MSRFEKYETRKISRLEIKNADYNPRSISTQAKARLRRGIEDNGIVQPFIWNQRTRNLVGGHQRLAILDDLEGGSTYEITVAVVDIPVTKEKKLNVLLNNQSAMGFWEEDKLLDLFREEGSEIDFEGFGFSKTEAKYFDDLMANHDEENRALIESMQEAMDFEDDIMGVDPEEEAERQRDKLERKRLYEQRVESIMVDKPSEDTWKLKTDEEKKAFDSTRNNYRNETFSYNFVKISFDSIDSKTAWLKNFGLPFKDVLHESEVPLGDPNEEVAPESSEP